MATIKVRALQDHPYNGKQYKEGEEYDFEIGDLNPDHVVLNGKSARVEKKQDYKTRDMKAEK